MTRIALSISVAGLFLLVGSAVAQNTLSIVRIGDEQFDVRFQNMAPVAGIQYTLTVPPGYTLERFEPTQTFSGDGWMFDSHQPIDSQINVVAIAHTEGLPSGTRTVASFSVRADGSGSMAPFAVSISNALIADRHARAMELVVSGLVVDLSVPYRDKQLPTFEMSAPYPNPFNPSTVVHYAVLTEGVVRIAVVDILGREIVTLREGFEAAGAKRVVWNGENNGGGTVASGIYFVVMTMGDVMKAQRVVMKK